MKIRVLYFEFDGAREFIEVVKPGDDIDLICDRLVDQYNPLLIWLEDQSGKFIRTL